MRHRQDHHKGFTLIEIMISVLLIGILAGIAIPNFIRSRTTAHTNICISNLRTIDHAIQQWALESKKAGNAPVQFSDISGYLKNSVTCPSGGASFADSYTISVVGAEPNCQRSPASHFIDQLIGTVASTASDSSANGDPSPSASGSSSLGGPAGNANGHGNGNSGNGKGGSKP